MTILNGTPYVTTLPVSRYAEVVGNHRQAKNIFCGCAIGEAFEQYHTVSKAQLGHATLRMMRQRELVDFAVRWIEQNRK